MATKQYFEICILGGGAGGLSVASGASQLGIKVALIEAKHMGGDCLNYGCVPSKTLLACAKHYYNAVNAKHYGFEAHPEEVKIEQIMAKVKAAIKHIEPHDSIERFTKLGVAIFQGSGKFISENQVLVGETVIEAKYFVIATGSEAFIPEIPGLEAINYLTNETIFDLAITPNHLLIIGGGPIGCEIAQAFAMLGIKVTLIDQGKILPKDEPDLVKMLRKQLLQQHNNLTLLENATTTAITKNNKQIQVNIKDKNGIDRNIQVSHIMVAAGRRANFDKLDLAKANIFHSARGISVDEHLRTSNKKVYAIGDVVGGLMFTHVASYHAGIIIRNILFRQRTKVNYAAIPWVTYTYPELAHVGLLLNEAKKRYAENTVISEFAFEDNDRAVAEGQLTGKIKLITTKKGKVLGVSILGLNAGELLAPWIDLINRGNSVKALTKNIIPYPTLSDINKQVVGEYYKPILFTLGVRRLVKFLKIFW